MTARCSLTSIGSTRQPFCLHTPFQTGQFTTHVPAEVLAELSSPLDCVDFGPFAHHGLPWQHRSSEAVAQRYVTCCVHDQCIDSSLGSSVRGHTCFVAMPQTQWHINRCLGAGSSVLSAKGFTAAAGTAACTESHRQNVCDFLYENVRSKALYKHGAVTFSPSEQRMSPVS